MRDPTRMSLLQGGALMQGGGGLIIDSSMLGSGVGPDPTVITPRASNQPAVRRYFVQNRLPPMTARQYLGTPSIALPAAASAAEIREYMLRSQAAADLDMRLQDYMPRHGLRGVRPSLSIDRERMERSRARDGMIPDAQWLTRMTRIVAGSRPPPRRNQHAVPIGLTYNQDATIRGQSRSVGAATYRPEDQAGYEPDWVPI